MKNGAPSRLFSGTSCGLVGIGLCGIGPIPSAAASLPVSTANTPGVALAAVASMPAILACAWGARRTYA
jgi:hypothetical protein